MNIKYFGHSCFLIEVDNLKILTDPFLSGNPLSKTNPIELKPDVILLSHDHQDHLGDAIEISKHSGAKVICVFELARYLNEFGVLTMDGNIGGTLDYRGIKFTFVKAVHSCDRGSPVGFVITTSAHTLYFAGDTSVFLDMKIIKDLYNPSIVMLPIDGIYNMGLREACYALKLLTPKMVIPMHYATFEVLKNTPEDFLREINLHSLDVIFSKFEILEEKSF